MVKPDDEQPDFTVFKPNQPGGAESGADAMKPLESAGEPMFTEDDGAAMADAAAPQDAAEPVEAVAPAPEGLAGLDFAAIGQPAEAGESSIALDARPSAEDEKKEQEEEKEAKPSLLARLAEASPYTVMLGISLGALVIAVLCLVLELKSYDFDISAKSARGRVALPQTYSAAHSTTAAAWPAQVKLSDTAARC